jgi:hypothetical protein
MRPQPIIALGSATQLWIQWAWIALDHRDEGRASRERDTGPPADNPELQASMISIVAAAVAIDGFATVVREHGVKPAAHSGPEPLGQAVFIWEALRANLEVDAYTQTWPRALKELWQLRSERSTGGLARRPFRRGGRVQTLDSQLVAGAATHPRAASPGWTIRLDVGDELVAFCPECDEREFGGPETAEPITGRSGEKPMEEVPNRAEPDEFNHNDCADERLRRKNRCGRSPRLVLRE